MSMEYLTTIELDVVNWVELYWHRFGKFPPLEDFSEEYPDIVLLDLLKKQAFKKAMHNRGILIHQNAGTPEGLSKAQLAAILAITDFMDHRSQSVKLKSLGISTTTWNGWLKDKSFKDYLHDLSANNFNDAIHVAHDGLMKRVAAGDTNAVKFYMELTGRYNSSSTEVENLKLVLVKLIEVLQIRIQDKDLLQAISNDFNLILAGEAPVQTAVTPKLKELI